MSWFLDMILIVQQDFVWLLINVNSGTIVYSYSKSAPEWSSLTQYSTIEYILFYKQLSTFYYYIQYTWFFTKLAFLHFLWILDITQIVMWKWSIVDSFLHIIISNSVFLTIDQNRLASYIESKYYNSLNLMRSWCKNTSRKY